MELGVRIKQLRSKKDWTQGQLALYSGLDRGYISQLETDRIKSPSGETFLKLAKALDVDEDVLYEAAGLKKAKHQPNEVISPEEAKQELLEKIYNDPYLSDRLKQSLELNISDYYDRSVVKPQKDKEKE